MRKNLRRVEAPRNSVNPWPFSRNRASNLDRFSRMRISIEKVKKQMRHRIRITSDYMRFENERARNWFISQKGKQEVSWHMHELLALANPWFSGILSGGFTMASIPRRSLIFNCHMIAQFDLVCSSARLIAFSGGTAIYTPCKFQVDFLIVVPRCSLANSSRFKLKMWVGVKM